MEAARVRSTISSSSAKATPRGRPQGPFRTSPWQPTRPSCARILPDRSYTLGVSEEESYQLMADSLHIGSIPLPSAVRCDQVGNVEGRYTCGWASSALVRSAKRSLLG